jgi:hypothetical protein
VVSTGDFPLDRLELLAGDEPEPPLPPLERPPVVPVEPWPDVASLIRCSA